MQTPTWRCDEVERTDQECLWALLEKMERITLLEYGLAMQVRVQAPSCMKQQGDSVCIRNPKHGFHQSGPDRQLDFCVVFGFDVGTFSTRDPRVPHLLVAHDTSIPPSAATSPVVVRVSFFLSHPLLQIDFTRRWVVNTEKRTYDAIVIGAGQGGSPIAEAFANAQRTTALIERAYIGGTCVNTGCTPSKTMIASAAAANWVSRALEYGIMAGPMRVNLTAIRDRKDSLLRSFPVSYTHLTLPTN